MDIISILQAWIKARFLKCLSITQAKSNLPDAYKKKKVYIVIRNVNKFIFPVSASQFIFQPPLKRLFLCTKVVCSHTFTQYILKDYIVSSKGCFPDTSKIRQDTLDPRCLYKDGRQTPDWCIVLVSP